MTSPDDRRQADLDWLYGSERPSADRTRVMSTDEMAELQRRRARAGGTEPAAAEGTAGTSRGRTQSSPGDAAGQTGAAEAARGDAARAAAAGAAAASGARVVHTEADVAGMGTPQRNDMAAPVAATRPRTTDRPSADRSSAARTGAGRAAAARPVVASSARSAGASLGAAAAAAGSRLSRAAGSRSGRRWGWKRIVLALLLAWLVWLLVVPLIATTRSHTIDDQPSGDRPADQPGTLTLLVGSDSRDGLSAAEQAKLRTGGTASAEGGRTDTMMLLYAPPSGKKVVISLPRDSYVTIPGHGKSKLNAAYAWGGPKLLVQTIENDTGLRIDHYAEVGFDGFANVVDAVGGAKVCLSAPMVDKDSHTNLPAGCQTLNGTQALGYVRMRKADPQGDLGRAKRQRQMIGIIANKAASPWTFINPVRYWKLNMAGMGAVKRGTDTGVTDLPGIGFDMMRSSSGGLQLAVPVSSTDATTAAGSSVLWDREKALAMFQQIAKGDTSNLEQYAK